MVTTFSDHLSFQISKIPLLPRRPNPGPTMCCAAKFLLGFALLLTPRGDLLDDGFPTIPNMPSHWVSPRVGRYRRDPVFSPGARPIL
jgi:hypothetical protein